MLRFMTSENQIKIDLMLSQILAHRFDVTLRAVEWGWGACKTRKVNNKYAFGSDFIYTNRNRRTWKKETTNTERRRERKIDTISFRCALRSFVWTIDETKHLYHQIHSTNAMWAYKLYDTIGTNWINVCDVRVVSGCRPFAASKCSSFTSPNAYRY